MKLARLKSFCVLSLLLLGAGTLQGQTPAGTEFTFQGQLQDGGQPADGLYDMQFSLWNALSGGSQLGGTVSVPNVLVVNGLFSVELDFTPAGFNSSSQIRRWMEVTVESTTLSPRQAITGAPFSVETRGIHIREDGGGLSVGIGRPASIGRFNVFNATTGAGGMYVETSAGGEPFYGYKSGNNVSVSHQVDGATGNWILRNGGDRLTVKSNGFVGINRDEQITTSETFGIYKNTVGSEFGGMYAETNPNGRPFYGYATGGTVQAYTYFDDATDAWRIYNGGERMVVLDNGNVGIGFNTPGFRFQVNGECAKPGGGSWATASDRRLKKNIKDLDGSLEKLLKLRGVTFEYNDPKSVSELEGERVGVIAQEVEKVFPDWVANRSDGYKAVTFRGFEALTVEALRELRDEKNTQVETLERKNNELHAENDELRDRMDILEQQLQQLAETMQTQQR